MRFRKHDGENFPHVSGYVCACNELNMMTVRAFSSRAGELATVSEFRKEIRRGQRDCGIEALDNFSCGISKCGIALFSEPAGCVFFSMLDGVKYYPSSPLTFSEPFPVSYWTFPMKLSSHGNGKLQSVMSLS